jgi:hypothetical protein
MDERGGSAGGQRRIDQVLGPRFTDRVDQLGLAELRARREEAEEAELVRRSAGGAQDVAGLPAILSDDAPGPFSAVPRVQVPSRAGEHRRRVERLVSDETVAHPPELDVEELTRAVELLAREEERVSTHRRAVQRMVDVLRDELARRHRDGTAQVSQLLE